jgi:hypothetical protein
MVQKNPKAGETAKGGGAVRFQGAIGKTLKVEMPRELWKDALGETESFRKRCRSGRKLQGRSKSKMEATLLTKGRSREIGESWQIMLSWWWHGDADEIPDGIRERWLTTKKQGIGER